MGPSLNSWSTQHPAGCICMTLPTSSRKGSYHFHTWPGTTYSCCWQDSNSLHVWWSYSPQEHFQHISDLPYRLHTTHHKSQNKLVHLLQPIGTQNLSHHAHCKRLQFVSVNTLLITGISTTHTIYCILHPVMHQRNWWLLLSVSKRLKNI